MSNKYPLSSKFKKIGNWNIISYKKENKNINKELLIKKILKILFFNRALISTPRFYYNTNKLNIYIFAYKNINKYKFSRYKIKEINGKLIFKLNKILTNFMGIPVSLKIIKLKKPYLNSEILIKYLALNFRKKSYFFIRKKIKKNLILMETEDLKIFFYNYKNIFTYLMDKQILSYINGIKWIFSGRLTKRRKASRARKFVYYKGIFEFNNTKSLTDYNFNNTNILKRGIGKKRVNNGSINIKVFIHNVINIV